MNQGKQGKPHSKLAALVWDVPVKVPLPFRDFPCIVTTIGAIINEEILVRNGKTIQRSEYLPRPWAKKKKRRAGEPTARWKNRKARLAEKESGEKKRGEKKEDN